MKPSRSGGADVVAYRELIDTYAEEAGLRKRLFVPVPVLTPWLSAKLSEICRFFVEENQLNQLVS